MGREWIKNFGLKLQLVSSIARVGGGSGGGAGFTQTYDSDRDNMAKKLIQKYPDVFSDKIGRYRYSRVLLFLKPDAKPVFCRPRPVPWAYKEEMEKELDRMVKENILTPVQSSDWATPYHLCGDYKSTVNKYLYEDVYALPTIDEIFSKLHNGEHFTKLDMSKAYNQFELEDGAKEILTISTTKGLFYQNRMPFGITTASGYFQRKLEQLFQDMKGVCVYQDDICITAPS